MSRAQIRLNEGDLMRQGDRATVLVVDDSDLVLVRASEWLGGGGFRVLMARSAAEVDAYLVGPGQPDLIIMDVMMPCLDGDVKARMLKEDDATTGIPILLLSSKNEDDLARLVVSSRADGYIRKPFTEGQLLGSVARTLAVT
jgi:twitching motility two-component system response regulator PilH